jgi:hypothetical protein
MDAYVFGKVSYTDEFGKPRYTEFHFIRGAALNKDGTDFQLQYAVDGNSAQ